LKLGSKQDEREEKSKHERRIIHGEQWTKQIKKIQTGNNSSNSDDVQIDKKDDADSTKTIAETTNEQVRQRRGNDI